MLYILTLIAYATGIFTPRGLLYYYY
jgi:hypothetical protein